MVTVNDSPQRVTSPVHEDAREFAAIFAGEADFADLTPAAMRVLTVAAALFLRTGALGTSVRDITSACGLSPGALYNHFESKQAVLHRIVRHGHARVERQLDGALAAAGPDPVEQLRHCVAAYVRGHLAHRSLARLVRREYVHLEGERLAEIVAVRRAIRGRIADVLRAGERRGDFALLGGRDGATQSALMVLDVCRSTTEWYSPREPHDLERLTADYVEAALRLVTAR